MAPNDSYRSQRSLLGAPVGWSLVPQENLVLVDQRRAFLKLTFLNFPLPAVLCGKAPPSGTEKFNYSRRELENRTCTALTSPWFAFEATTVCWWLKNIAVSRSDCILLVISVCWSNPFLSWLFQDPRFKLTSPLLFLQCYDIVKWRNAAMSLCPWGTTLHHFLLPLKKIC